MSEQIAVLPCPHCQQRVRVPTNRGQLRVRCPACNYRWLWVPPSAGPSDSLAELLQRLGADADFARVTLERNGENLRSWMPPLRDGEVSLAVEAARSALAPVEAAQHHTSPSPHPVAASEKAGATNGRSPGWWKFWQRRARSEVVSNAVEQDQSPKEAVRAQEFLLEGTRFALFSDEQQFFDECRRSAQAALKISFGNFWPMLSRGYERNAVGAGIRLLCGGCFSEPPPSFVSSLGGHAPQVIFARTDGPPIDPVGSARRGVCPWCEWTVGIAVWDEAPLGEMFAEDLRRLHELWAQRAQLWWRRNTDRRDARCDYCSDRIDHLEGYLRINALICKTCATPADALEQLRENPSYFGPSEVRRARNLAAGCWHFEAPQIR